MAWSCFSLYKAINSRRVKTSGLCVSFCEDQKRATRLGVASVMPLWMLLFPMDLIVEPSYSLYPSLESRSAETARIAWLSCNERLRSHPPTRPSL